MKNITISGLATVVIAVAVIYLAREPIAVYAQERFTADMFIPEDTDQYSPGISVGESFPKIRAWYGATERQDVQEFMGTKGLIVFMNRSVDW
jgi:hypothetical protein|tara:strand:- start:895 stop:1170 length:276 start_codon:yes stop_codon:yes gene_type:complete